MALKDDIEALKAELDEVKAKVDTLTTSGGTVDLAPVLSAIADLKAALGY